MKRKKDVNTQNCICHFADKDADESFTFLRDVPQVPLKALKVTLMTFWKSIVALFLEN